MENMVGYHRIIIILILLAVVSRYCDTQLEMVKVYTYLLNFTTQKIVEKRGGCTRILGRF